MNDHQQRGPPMTETETQPIQKCVLHVGCGRKRSNKLHSMFRGADWREIRVDIDAAVEPDLVADMTSMPEIETATIDAIWSSHNLEHLFAHEVPNALAEFLRVLKPGGFLFATLPDLQKVGEYLAQGRLEQTIYESPAGPITALDICFGHGKSIAGGNKFMAHKTGFTSLTLFQKLAASGFINIQIDRRHLDLWATAFKPN